MDFILEARDILKDYRVVGKIYNHCRRKKNLEEKSIEEDSDVNDDELQKQIVKVEHVTEECGRWFEV